MRVCPKCGYEEPAYWRPSFQRNPGGEVDVCHINDLELHEPKFADALKQKRGSVIIKEPFAFILNLKAVYVKRVRLKTYECGGKSAFAIPSEPRAKHHPSYQGRNRKKVNQRRLDEVCAHKEKTQ